MQGLADGYFVIPYTIGDYIAGTPRPTISVEHEAFKESAQAMQTQINRVLNIKGQRTMLDFHRQLGHIMWDNVGMARTKASLTKAIGEIQTLRGEFWQDVRVPGEANNLNQNLERALRVADFLEFGELLARDALNREESCGGHFREEYQTEEGEALRNDEDFSYVAAWEWTGENQTPVLHKEQLIFEEVHPSQRSYK
jgi:succinate dehydrogenase / fumarate reductase flavoprotein subunit